MFPSLKNHPFAVEAFFESSLVLTYAIPKQEIQHLIPECLELDTFNDHWAFVAIAMVQTQHLRPKGFPVWMGNDFFLAGMRIFVRYTNQQGKRLRGLYILKSETNKKKMEVLGNIFTHYQYTTTDISISRTGGILSVLSNGSAIDIEVNVTNTQASLPAGSPFNDWKEARRFAGPLPFTFSYNPQSKEVLIIEGLRQHWVPTPVEVVKSKVGFMEQGVFQGATLANAFLIDDIPYYWKKGKLETWAA